MDLEMTGIAQVRAFADLPFERYLKVNLQDICLNLSIAVLLTNLESSKLVFVYSFQPLKRPSKPDLTTSSSSPGRDSDTVPLFKSMLAQRISILIMEWIGINGSTKVRPHAL